MRRFLRILVGLALLSLTLVFPRPYTSPQAAPGNLPPLVTVSATARPMLDELLDLNTATASQLEDLPGIGPVRAKAILDYREKNGPFQQFEELAAVKGIGPALMDRLRPLVTVAIQP